mmetsp:Transcript_104608/g.249034  ORF Transcript_104608/g.249034 Transcript_104608/m.249034 type:complete len:201 (-) Transcript_104608:1526-2128(-)
MPPCLTDLLALRERRAPTDEQREPIPGVPRRSFLELTSIESGVAGRPMSKAMAETEPADADLNMPGVASLMLEHGLDGALSSSSVSMRYSWVLPIASNMAVMLDFRTRPPLCPSPLDSSSMWKASGSLVRRPAAGAPAMTQGRFDLGDVAGGCGSTGKDSVGTRTTAPMIRRLVRPIALVGDTGRSGTVAGQTSTASSTG